MAGKSEPVVRSIERAFTLLEALARDGGAMGLSDLADVAGLPVPTMHRLARTLVALGYVRQEPSRRYILGPRVLLLYDGAAKMLNSMAQPHLARLVDEVGETANLAMLDGDQVVYVSQCPSRHAMRMFTEVGRRVLPHCTAVGKAMMASMPDSAVRIQLNRTGMPRETDHTITDQDVFLDELREIAERGYATDDGEQEIGVRCVAVVVPGHTARLALSVSGPTARMDGDLIARAVPALLRASDALSSELSG